MQTSLYYSAHLTLSPICIAFNDFNIIRVLIPLEPSWFIIVKVHLLRALDACTFNVQIDRMYNVHIYATLSITQHVAYSVTGSNTERRNDAFEANDDKQQGS